MLLRIGIHKYHLAIGFLCFYEEANQLNLFEFIYKPLFTFVLSVWRPSIYLKIGKKTIIWWTKGLLNIMDKAVYLGRGKHGS